MALTATKTIIEQGFNTVSYLVAIQDTTGEHHLEFTHPLTFDPTWVEVIPVYNASAPAAPAAILAEVLYSSVPTPSLSYRYGTGATRSIFLYKPNLAAETTYIKVHLGRTHSEPT
jgi:hypothetical protein